MLLFHWVSRKSFGFVTGSDLRRPHLAAVRQRFPIAPICQQSIREMTRTQRTPTEVMSAARQAPGCCRFYGRLGADGDHLKTPEDPVRGGRRILLLHDRPGAPLLKTRRTRWTRRHYDPPWRARRRTAFEGFSWRTTISTGSFTVSSRPAPLRFDEESPPARHRQIRPGHRTRSGDGAAIAAASGGKGDRGFRG